MLHIALNSVLTFLALVVPCLSTDAAWPSLSSQLLLAVPISISIPGQPKPARRLLLINRSDSLVGVARRACRQFAKSRIEACASGCVCSHAAHTLLTHCPHALPSRTPHALLSCCLHAAHMPLMCCSSCCSHTTHTVCSHTIHTVCSHTTHTVCSHIALCRYSQ